MKESADEFSGLVRLEPSLAELEERARSVVDDGRSSFFCSSFVWLPLSFLLRDRVGVDRRGEEGEPRTGPLYDSRSYEVAYVHLSRLLPPCRDCGCRIFEPWRGEGFERG